MATPDALFSLADVERARTEAHAAGLAAGKAEGIALGTEQERARIRDVEAQLLPGHEALIATLKADGKTSGAQAAMQVLKAERDKLGSQLAALHADAPAPVPQAAAPQGPSGSVDPSAPIEERCKAQWDGDAGLRAEYGNNFDRFVAYTKAQERGLVKVYQGRKG
jgi:hypothetical protein